MKTKKQTKDYKLIGYLRTAIRNATKAHDRYQAMIAEKRLKQLLRG